MYQLLEHFEKDIPMEAIDLEKECIRLGNAKFKKSEKEIIRNAGITKNDFMSDIQTREVVIKNFINVLKEKKAKHEAKLQI